MKKVNLDLPEKPEGASVLLFIVVALFKIKPARTILVRLNVFASVLVQRLFLPPMFES